jgi:hypothetical protein
MNRRGRTGKNDLHSYLLQAPWQARRKKRYDEGTYRYGSTDKPYKQTSCRRLLFRVILSHKETYISDWGEIENQMRLVRPPNVSSKPYDCADRCSKNCSEIRTPCWRTTQPSRRRPWTR